MALAFERLRGLTAIAAMAAFAGCTNVNLPVVGTFDNGFGGSEPSRPQPDARGVITYPTYQVAVAQGGDTVTALAQRLGLDPAAVARSNGLPEDATLREGEVILLPGGVAPAATDGDAITPGGEVSVETLAGDALDRADPGSAATTAAAPSAPSGPEPRRHRVARGETAFTIARLYNVSPRALGDWNGLDQNLSVREGQVLLIPVVSAAAPSGEDTSEPGTGSPTPVPPSATAPQPAENPPPAAATGGESSPLESPQTAASATRLQQPVAGRIIRGYQPGSNEGLDFAANTGSPVRAAESGTVAAITRDVDEIPILVIRHSNNLLTVYANIDDIQVEKGDSVARGQTIAEVGAGSPSFLHFEVREGFDSVDPLPYLSQ